MIAITEFKKGSKMKGFISKGLIGLTILATTTWANVARADWVRVLTDQQSNDVFLIEPSTIQFDNGRYYFWANISLIEPRYYPEYEGELASANLFLATECNSNSIQKYQEEGFDIEGNSLGTLEGSINYPIIGRGTKAIQNFVCNR